MLLLIAGIIQVIMAVVVLVSMIALLNQVNESSYCKDRYVSCTEDTDGNVCADSWYGDDLCYKNCVGDDYCSTYSPKGTTSCAAPTPPTPSSPPPHPDLTLRPHPYQQLL